MNKISRFFINVMFLLVGMLFLAPTVNSEISIDGVQTADVTTSGFSVVWQTSEVAEPGITIFSDPAGTNEITSEFEITAFPLQGGNPETIDEYQAEYDMFIVRECAKTLGLMKIRVHGCDPDTIYYYRVSAQGNSESAFWPESSFAPVTTATMNSFIGDSKQLLLTLSNSQGTLDAAGWMVTASSTEAVSPVSSYVSDGAGENQAYLNLDRFFGADGMNLSLSGDHEINLEIKGFASGEITSALNLYFSNNFYVSTLYPMEISVDAFIDSDGDGLPDTIEDAWCTDPNVADTDVDGILDGTEDANHNGIVDDAETDPCDDDTDDDGLLDGEEDVNHNGIVDGQETNPTSADTDNDGLPDGWEVNNNLNPLVDDAFDDSDLDRFCNLREFLSQTDPQNNQQIPPIIADFEPDGDTDGMDLTTLRNEFGRNNCSEIPCDCDFDDDGDVDNIDVHLFSEDFGRMNIQ